MNTVLWLLAVQGALGAFDTLYYHEWRARLPAGVPGTRHVGQTHVQLRRGRAAEREHPGADAAGRVAEQEDTRPLELLGASLGSCIAYYVHHFFHARGLPADDLKVEVSNTRAKNPTRIDSFQVKVTLPADVPEKYMPLLNRILETCPAHNTLGMGARIDVEFLEPALSTAAAS